MKEYTKRPECLSRVIVLDDKVIPYRITDGVYQARYRKKGYNVEASSKDFNVMLEKLRARMAEVEKGELYVREGLERRVPLFRDYAAGWMEQKSAAVKETTMRIYRRLIDLYLVPAFGDRQMDQVTRSDVQLFVNGVAADGKPRTAEMALGLLGAVYGAASDDYCFRDPVRRVALPHYEVRKGTALSRDEEETLKAYCLENRESGWASSLLLLLYTGMRIGELASATRDDTYVYCVSEKTRKGYREVTRRIPITPMLRRVLPSVDMAKAAAGKRATVDRALKRLFPDRHPHELRYTFITRTKECGVNPEVVMMWAGHARDRDVASSRVNMGYTDYSDGYVLSEALKVDYGPGERVETDA